MKDVSTIWERPITLSDVQPLLTTEMIQSAEAQMGYRLPAAYIELMKTQNGGNIRCGFENDDKVWHTRIFGIGPNKDAITKNEALPFSPPGLFPIDGHNIYWHLSLDYRKNPDSPSVVLIEFEDGLVISEKIIGKTFSEYLDKLIVFEDHEIFVVETLMPIGKVVRIVSLVLDTYIKALFSGGDLYYFGFYGDRDVRISLQSNKVPKYQHEIPLPAHATERDDLPDRILRHPEVDENYVFLEIEQETYEGQRYDIVQRFRDAGLVIHSMNHYLS